MALSKTFKKGVRKAARKARGKVIKRYFGKGYAPKVNKIVSDVARLSKMINAEKKVIDVNPASANFAHFGNAGATVDGAYCVDVTPAITQGITRSTRNGNSVKLYTACMDIRVDQGATAGSNYTYIGYLVRRPDAQVALTATQIKDQMFEVNPFTSIRDLNSNRDPESGMKGYKIVKKFRGSFPVDAVSGVDQFRHHKFPLKLGFHLRYNSDGSTKVEQNQLVLIVFASIGNTTTTNTLNMKCNVRYYYYDN